MKNHKIAYLGMAALLFAAPISARAQQSPTPPLGGTIVATQAEGGNCSNSSYWSGTVTGSIGKGTATFGCYNSNEYTPLPPPQPVIPGVYNCAPVFTMITVTTDKFPDGIELNIEGAECSGFQSRTDNFPGTITGGFDLAKLIPHDHYYYDSYWGTFSGTIQRDGKLIVHFEGHLY